MITIIVPGKPIPLPRQRHRIVKTPTSMYVQSYTPSDGNAAQWKELVARFARQAISKPLEGPLHVSAQFIFQVKSNPQSWRIKTPDIDNLVKMIFDAMNGIVYQDDKQVASLSAIKTESTEKCCAIIAIEQLEEPLSCV